MSRDTTTTLFWAGLSPCPNDTFMFHGIMTGEVKVPGVQFHPVFEDIESLNQRAVEDRDPLPITKLSLPALAQVAHRYTILGSGAALGRGCGPLVVHRGERGGLGAIALLAGKTVAVPGLNTTAHLLLRIFGPKDMDIVPLRFDQIMPAVDRGECDAGVIIHESRFTYPRYGLSELADLGALWERETGLPLPLGVICVRRSVDGHLADRIETGLRESIVAARTDPSRSKAWVREHADEMSEEVCAKHIALYVNEFSEALGAEGRSAIDELLARGRAAGLLPHDKPSPWRHA